MKRLRRDKKHLRISSEPNILQGHTQRVLQKGRERIMLELRMFRIIRDLTLKDQDRSCRQIDRREYSRFSRFIDLIQIKHSLSI